MEYAADIRMKDIPGYEGEYAATSCGKIWSYKQKKFLSTSKIGKNEYLQVILSKKGKRKGKLVHRLVALTYLTNPHPKKWKHVDHIEHEGTWHPECLKNLRWSERRENDCNRKTNIAVTDTQKWNYYCSLAMAQRETGINWKNIKKQCEQFHAFPKGKMPRFIFCEDTTPQIVKQYYYTHPDKWEADSKMWGNCYGHYNVKADAV